MIDTTAVVEAITKQGFHCQIDGFRHAYSKKVKQDAVLGLDVLFQQLNTPDKESRRMGPSQIAHLASMELRSLQSNECAIRMVEGKTGLPSVLYKYIPADLIYKGATGSLRATQPSSLNDMMECSITPMRNYGANASRYRAMLGAKIKECLGVTLSQGELAKLWVTGSESKELSRIIREYLDTKVGVVSLSKDALVPTMWAHYAQNSGVVVGYDTETLAKIGFDMRSVTYLEMTPKFEPASNDMIRASFVDRESMEQNAAAGKIVLGYQILCSVDLTAFSPDWKSLARLLFVKGKGWAYEQEVRLLVDLEKARDTRKVDRYCNPIKVIDIPSEAIREIFRGPRTSKKDMARAIKEARGENLKGLYERSTSFHSFRIQATGGSHH